MILYKYRKEAGQIRAGQGEYMKYIDMLANDEYTDHVDIWEAFDEVAASIGENELLIAISKAIGTDELKSLLKDIVKDYDLVEEDD